MLEVTIQVNAPGYMAQGVKESLAMAAEAYGAASVTRVRDMEAVPYQQERISGTGGNFNGSV